MEGREHQQNLKYLKRKNYLKSPDIGTDSSFYCFMYLPLKITRNLFLPFIYLIYIFTEEFSEVTSCSEG